MLAVLALDALPQAAVVINASGHILLRNRLANEMFPAGGELAGVLQSVAPAEFDWSYSLSGEPEEFVHRNVCLKSLQGHQITADLYVRHLGKLCPEAGSEGNDLSATFLVVVQDVSARITMERRLAATERLAAIGKLSAKVAHELNNPLDGVQRYLGLAQRTEGEESRGYLRKAHGGLMRMARIIRDLMGQSDGSGQETSPARGLLDEAITTMQPRAQAQGVIVTVDAVDGEPMLLGSDIFQVFCNVIKNALDAMPEGGQLTVRLYRDGSDCVVEFADTGSGIAPREAQRIFEPFVTSKPSGQGLGLGLAICREIVSKNGGQISAGPRENRGALVTVRLPLLRRGQTEGNLP